MTKRLAVILALLVAVAAAGRGEMGFKALSATATSQTFYLPVASDIVGLCNLGADDVHFRLFWEGETPATATTAHSVLPAGTAAAPYCISFGKAPTQPAPWRFVSVVCASSETATVHLQWF